MVDTVGRSRPVVGLGSVMVMAELASSKEPSCIAATAEITAGVRNAARIERNIAAIIRAATAYTNAGVGIAAEVNKEVAVTDAGRP